MAASPDRRLAGDRLVAATVTPIPQSIFETRKTLRDAWRRYSRKVGNSGLTFHNLRGTVATRLAEAGCTPAEIATSPGTAYAT